nr:MAG TPA: hypothetical protein [Caudoviricetes sp.]
MTDCTKYQQRVASAVGCQSGQFPPKSREC